MKISKLAKKYHGIKARGRAARYIRLPEWPPSSTVEIRPSHDYIKNKINLPRAVTYINTDAYGFIGPSAVHSSPDLRIAFLGSSTTENRFISEDKRFPYVVGRMLESLIDKRVNTYNAGYRGNNIVHCMNTFINKVLCIRPDIVLVMSNIIDLNTLLLDQTYWFSHSSDRKAKFNSRTLICEAEPTLLRRLSRSIKTAISSDSSPPSICEAITPFGADGYEKIFKSLVSTIVSCDIWPIIMTEPGLLSEYNTADTDYKTNKINMMKVKYSENKYVEHFRMFNCIVRAIANELGVGLIDLDVMLSGDEMNFIDLNHLSEIGNQNASIIISKYILENHRQHIGSRRDENYSD